MQQFTLPPEPRDHSGGKGGAAAGAAAGRAEPAGLVPKGQLWSPVVAAAAAAALPARVRIVAEDVQDALEQLQLLRARRGTRCGRDSRRARAFCCKLAYNFVSYLTMNRYTYRH